VEKNAMSVHFVLSDLRLRGRRAIPPFRRGSALRTGGADDIYLTVDKADHSETAAGASRCENFRNPAHFVGYRTDGVINFRLVCPISLADGANP
jgi:hypothetical protein